MVERDQQKIKDAGRTIKAIAKQLQNPLAGIMRVLNALDLLAPLFPELPLIDTSPFGDAIESLANNRDDVTPGNGQNTKHSEYVMASDANKPFKNSLLNSTSSGKEHTVSVPVFPLGMQQTTNLKSALNIPGINQNENQRAKEAHAKMMFDNRHKAISSSKNSLSPGSVSGLENQVHSILQPKTKNSPNSSLTKSNPNEKTAANASQSNSTAIPLFSGLINAEKDKNKSPEKNSIELIDALADQLLIASNNVNSTSQGYYKQTVAEPESNSRRPDFLSNPNRPANLETDERQSIEPGGDIPVKKGFNFKELSKEVQSEVPRWDANELASLVNDVLAEQARRQGVDLS